MLTGALLVSIGGALLASPIAFLAMSDVFIDSNPGLLSELVAPSGILGMTGAVMILGAIWRDYVDVALLIGAVVYGSYGLSRVISMMLHGLPTKPLITATIVELAVAAFLITLRLRTLRQRCSRQPSGKVRP